MSSREQFVCFPCGHCWYDTYSLWQGYMSSCPRCGRNCQAYRDTEMFADRQEMAGLGVYGPLFDDPDFYGYEKTEEDLEAERDQIHDEIAESLGAVESVTSGADEDIGADADVGADGEASGEGL